MKRIAPILALLFTIPAFADTSVSGNIGTNTTWTTAGSPYILNGNVTIGGPAGPTLTIQPGVVVKGNGGSQILVGYYDNGALVANGTAAQPIVFTANGSTAAGFWYGLRFGPIAGSPASSLAYATVEYGGSAFYALGGITILAASPLLDHVTSRVHQYAGIKIENGTPTIASSSVRDNAGHGIYLTGGGATLSDVALVANSGVAVSAPAASQFSGMTGLSATGNGTNAVEYRSGTISANRTWQTSAIPYVVTGDVFVEGTAAPVLTIAAGNTIRFNSGGQIAVNYGNNGGLAANGTASAPIVFTANGSTAAGYWLGLFFGNAAGGTPSSMSYATIEYGGSSGYGRGGVTTYTGAPSFDHLTIRSNAYAGAVVYGGSPSFTASTITANGGPGIFGINPAAFTLTNDAFTNNNGYAVTVPCRSTFTDTSGLSAAGNGSGRDAIEIRAGSIIGNTTWPLSALPYVVTGDVFVEGASAPVLTIASGNTIRFNSGGQIAVNYGNKGGLTANGTASAPIVFTANGSTAAGYWLGLFFGNTTGGTPSSMSYATIEYGGSSGYGRGGVTTTSGAPSFDHLTIRNNSYAGAAVYGGSPSFTASTVTANGGPGIFGINPAAFTLTNDAFTNNNGYAVTVPCRSTFTDTSGLSAAGNGSGRDAIEIRAGTIIGNTTWPLSALPYVVTGDVFVEGTAAPVLTIAAGNTIRFNSGGQVAVNYGNKGGLAANGTASAPIVFTANGSTAAGYWLGLYFGATAGGPQSNVSYATVEYGGSSYYGRGGVTTTSGALSFDHLTIRNNQYAGLMAAGNSTARITNTLFSANTEGVKTSSNATVSAALNYWNAAGGPCLVGSCAAGQQSVSSGVGYEPWLTSAPTDPQFISSAIVKNRTFSPAIGAVLSVDYTTALTGPSTVTIRNASNAVVRTFTGSKGMGLVQWDGANDGGILQPDGTYSYEIASTAPPQPPAAIAKGLVILDSTKTLTLSNPVVSPAFFSPNADNVQDVATVVAATNYDDAAWTVSVINESNTVLQTQHGSGTAVSYTWDGKSESKIMILDGLYTFRVEATEGTAAVQKSATTTLDNTLPAVSIAAPAANDVLSNVYANGATNVTPTGGVADANLLSWTAQYGSGAAPATWTTFGSGTTAVSGALGAWETANSVNGTYALRLLAADKAGNAAAITTTPLVIGNFKATQSAYQFNVATGGTVTYASTVPFPLTETIVVKNEAGSVVRNLVTAVPRAAGTFNDVFNGRNDANALLPDGPYFYVATVTDGAHTMTWDLTNDFRNDYFAYNDWLGIQPYDPFNNSPLRFNYDFDQPARVTIATKTTGGSVNGDCGAPSATFFCPVIKRWEEAGTHSFSWSGIDHTGAYRAIRSLGIIANSASFPKNAVVMFGKSPKVENVRVTPPVYGPAVGTQTVEFDLTTYQSQSANITIDFTNLSTLSTLRTLTLTGQAAGHRTADWDGRADNGMLVAPGFYAVTVTATDAQGTVVKGDILTTIKY
jgi:flagellar hook assembly protein FlgD